MDINILLDLAKSLNSKNSDYETAKRLTIDPSAIYAWRRGARKPTQEQIISLAEIADLDPLQTLAIFESQNAKSDKMTDFWHDVAYNRLVANQ